MKTKNELLGLAAIAIGYKVYFNRADACQLTTDGTDATYVGFWNPLNDNGTALKLSAELGIGLKYMFDETPTGLRRGVIAQFMQYECEIWGPCINECTRRAIVTVAALIGESL